MRDDNPRAAAVIAAQHSSWTTSRLAVWIRHYEPRLTISDAGRLADALARGPLAEVWIAGVTEGKRRHAAGE